MIKKFTLMELMDGLLHSGFSHDDVESVVNVIFEVEENWQIDDIPSGLQRKIIDKHLGEKYEN